MSRSGPNISPPKTKAALKVAEDAMLYVVKYVAANAGTVKINVIASCVFPLGIDQF